MSSDTTNQPPVMARTDNGDHQQAKGDPPPNRPPKTPGTRSPKVRPPFAGDHLPLPGVSDSSVVSPVRIRRTAQKRPTITPSIEPGKPEGFAMTDPYVRRFWVAAIGPGAVADLLRLAAAAQSDRSLRTPTHLPTLIRYGLARREGTRLTVPDRVPPLPQDLRDRLRPPVRQELLADLRRRRAV